MTISLSIRNENGEYTPVLLYNTFTMDERLDEELDGGLAQSYMQSEEEIAEFAEAIVTLYDGKTKKRIPFYAFDDVEKRANGYHRHMLELVEPTRWLMGITCDGLKITQPIDENATKKTLYDTLERVLRCCNTKTTSEAVGLLTIDESIKPMLQAVVSPEFAWQAQTLLFEVLQDIADVVDCVPRVIESADGQLKTLTLVKINDEIGEYEI